MLKTLIVGNTDRYMDKVSYKEAKYPKVLINVLPVRSWFVQNIFLGS